MLQKYPCCLIEALTHACNEYLAKGLTETALTTLWVVCSENGQVQVGHFLLPGQVYVATSKISFQYATLGMMLEKIQPASHYVF